jgi:GNAT superfamily N-acetyltransferase
VEEFARTVGCGFAGDAEPRAEDLDRWRRCAAHPRSVVLTAIRDGRMIGAGSVEVLGEAAALFGLSVLPEFRGRGVQQALIAARLSLAAARGARVATISARPGVATERNARRLGFQLGYTKALLVRPGPGLAPVVG